MTNGSSELVATKTMIQIMNQKTIFEVIKDFYSKCGGYTFDTTISPFLLLIFANN